MAENSHVSLHTKYFSPLFPLLMGTDLASHFLDSRKELEYEFVFQEPTAA